MRGTAFPQINLDRIRFPFSIRTHDHEIQRDTPHDSFFRQTLANLGVFAGDERRVPRVGRKYATQITLPGWAAQELVVRRYNSTTPSGAMRSRTLGPRLS